MDQKKRGDRTTHYGLPITDKEVAMKTTTKKTAALKPLSEETTPYGGKRFRTPVRKDEFTGTQGSPIPAYIFDIDGTLQGWGQGAQQEVLDWAEKLYQDDPHAVFLVVTARDHGSFGYTTSFDWLMKHFPYPFIGPFARPTDDPRFTTEFKRELAQGFEDIGLYQIMGAADDNEWVIKMWKQWAIDHFEDPADFDLLECSYGTYAGWRKDLPSKSHTGYGSYGTTATGTHKGERWVNGGMVNGKWAQGHWEDEATHRPAGTNRYDGATVLDKDPAWKGYFEERYGEEIEVVSETGEREERLNARLDLEDDVYAVYPDLTRQEIEAMDVHELQLLLRGDFGAAARTESFELSDQTQPLDVSEILAGDAPGGGLSDDEITLIAEAEAQEHALRTI